MSLSDTAKTILERGFAAFRNTRVRPEGGHTRIDDRYGERRSVLKFGYVVGAIAYEAAQLQGYKNARDEAFEDDSARKWVRNLFGVNDSEVRDIESGFDCFFEPEYLPCDECDYEDETCESEVHGLDARRAAMEENNMPYMSEMWQVGWHVAKRAVKFYLELDEAEDEAWEVYADQNLAEYVPRKPLASLVSQREMDEIVQQFIEECEEDEDYIEKVVMHA